jgi:hypothetical protein
MDVAAKVLGDVVGGGKVRAVDVQVPGLSV